MDGGTTSGYSLIGSVNSAIAPPIVMNAEMTAAKIGRSMKKCDSFTQYLLLVGHRGVAGTRGGGRGVQRQLVGLARGGDDRRRGVTCPDVVAGPRVGGCGLGAGRYVGAAARLGGVRRSGSAGRCTGAGRLIAVRSCRGAAG